MTGSFADRLLTDADVALPDVPVATPAMLADAERVLAGRWLLVGEEFVLGPDPDWRVNPSADKEWQIAQHKHYFGRNLLHGLLATGDRRYLQTWSTLLRSWLDRMGTGFITVSDAQVEALRLRSWVESLLLLREAHRAGLLAGAGDREADDLVADDLLRAWVERMGDEARYVSTHLKPVRNHRTFQLHSVFLVGLCVPQAPGAAELVESAVQLLTDNLLREVLPDGVHVEMATHYHQLVAETALDVVILAGRNGIRLDPELLRRIHAMTRWSAWLTWPDGSIPLLGDSDDGDHVALLIGAGQNFDDPELSWVGSRGATGRPPAVPSRDFPDAGYTVLTDTAQATEGPAGYGRRTHVLVDTARLGEGAHAHYDALSLVLHCDGAPALVDPGRYTYSGELDPDGVDWRHTFKTTRAHNTVTVDGRDQTRYLSRNKHGPDAVVVDRAVHVGRAGDWVAAAVHSDEYTAVHGRLVLYPWRQYLLVADRVAAPDGDGGVHTGELAWHLPAGPDPQLRDEPADGGRRTVWVDGGPAQLLLEVAGDADVRVDQGWVSTLYGVKAPAPVVRASWGTVGDGLAVTAVAPRSTGVRLVSLTALGTGEAGSAGQPGWPGTPAWEARLDTPDGPVRDRLWLPRRPGRIRTADGVDVTVGGRFLLVRHDAAGAPVGATGERVAGTVAGMPLTDLLDPPA